MNDTYGYVPTQDELYEAFKRTLHMRTPALQRIIRHDLTTADAVAALIVLADRVDKPELVNYHDYLRSDRWRAIRARKLAESVRRCEKCNSTQQLQVHHKTYVRLGRERMSDLQVLCDTCHARHHGKAA